MRKHIFGPVPSRRFGRSLGIDCNAPKTCTLDCVFCQLGPTAHKAVSPQTPVRVEDLLQEIEQWLKTDGQADVLTFSGSGEPTLHPGLGEIIEGIRSMCSMKILLLTNGTLLHRPEVRAAAQKADMVKYSLSAWDAASFETINRPHPDITFQSLLSGLQAFRQNFNGEFYQETFVIQDVNDTPEAMEKIAAYSQSIRPDRVQLNTAVRPPAQSWVQPVGPERLQQLALHFDPPAEIIAEFRSQQQPEVNLKVEHILEMLKRRPCTLEDVAHSFGLHPNEATKYLGRLVRRGEVRAETLGESTYYRATERM